MMGTAVGRLLALLLCLGLAAGAAPAQVAPEVRPEVREEAERARGTALASLARDGADVAALLALGRAELQLGDGEAALGAARRAHAEASPGPARFIAARLAAKANAELGRWTRAQVWLRRARADAPDAEAVAALARDYRTLRARNPLAVALSFGIAPSSNVNNGSASAFVTLPGFVDPATGQPFQFEINGEGRALSGLRISGGATLSYRLGRSGRSETAVEAQALGRTYVLSGDARERAPEARGSDFADVTASLGLAHRWRPEGASAPSSAALTLGQTWYDADPYVAFLQGSFSRGFRLGARDRLDLTELVERTWRLEEGEAYWSLGGRLRWTRALASGRASLHLGLRDGLTDLPDVGYDGATLGAGFDWGRPIRGLRLGVSGEADWRRYDLTRYGVEAREDRTLRVRAAMGLPRLDLYGFHPSVSVEAFRTESNVPLYDRAGLAVDLGVRSSF